MKKFSNYLLAGLLAHSLALQSMKLDTSEVILPALLLNKWKNCTPHTVQIFYGANRNETGKEIIQTLQPGQEVIINKIIPFVASDDVPPIALLDLVSEYPEGQTFKLFILGLKCANFNLIRQGIQAPKNEVSIQCVAFHGTCTETFKWEHFEQPPAKVFIDAEIGYGTFYGYPRTYITSIAPAVPDSLKLIALKKVKDLIKDNVIPLEHAKKVLPLDLHESLLE